MRARSLLLPLMLLAAPAWAQAPDAGSEDPGLSEGATRGHLDQARFFFKKGWTADAAAELDAALATPAGEASYAVNWLAAELRYAQLDAEGAARHARIAEGLAADRDQALQAAAFADAIDRSFGVVVITAPYEGVSSRLQLDRESALLDPELKRFVDELALAWTRPQELPLRVALPTGDYLIQGLPVTAKAGVEAGLELPMSSLGSRGFAALQVSRLELAVGMGAYLGASMAHVKPGLEAQLGFTQPLAGLLLGVTWDYALHSYGVQGQADALGTRGFSVGLRLGRELMVGGPLAFRPSLGYRFGALPGVGLSCVGASDPAAGPFDCAALSEDVAGDLLVYANARAHIPYADLAVEWRRAGRTTATGLGVRIAYEQVIAKVPASGTASVADQPDPVSWSGTSFIQTSPAIRMLSSVSVAF